LLTGQHKLRWVSGFIEQQLQVDVTFMHQAVFGCKLGIKKFAGKSGF